MKRQTMKYYPECVNCGSMNVRVALSSDLEQFEGTGIVIPAGPSRIDYYVCNVCGEVCAYRIQGIRLKDM